MAPAYSPLCPKTTSFGWSFLFVYSWPQLARVEYNVPMKNFTYVSALALLLLPGVTQAQFGGIDTFFLNVMTFINSILIPLVFAVALLAFIYGMYRYFILGGDNDGDRETGRSLMVWAIIGFVLMVSIWGIVNLLANGLSGSLGPNDGPTTIPQGPSIGR